MTHSEDALPTGAHYLPVINGYKIVGIVPVKHDGAMRPPYVIVFHRPAKFTPTRRPDWGTAFWYEGDSSWCWGAYDFENLESAFQNAAVRAGREGGQDIFGVSQREDEAYVPDFEYGGEGG